MPLHVTKCDHLFCDIDNDILIDKLDDNLEIMEYCAEFTIPTRTISNKSKGIPGWNDFVRPFKDKSILCNELWVSAGKPTSGTLFDERKFARTRYHWAIRYVKKNKESIILNKTAEQLSQKSFRNFWKFIKKYNGNVNVSSKIIDDKCTDETIASHFRTIYDSLYSSVKDEDLNNTKLRIDNLIKKNCCSTNCHNVSGDTIRSAIKCLSNGKNDEVYNVFSDNFIHATDLACDILGILTSTMLKHGTASELINKAIIKPIPKNKTKSLSDSKNYRAISKNSIMSKILDNVLINLMGDKISTSTYQFAYKAGFSTSLCSFLVAETISYYRSRGSNVYMVSLDATKAFDRVQYSKLFNKLVNRNVCPMIIRFLLNSYLISKSVVKWNNQTSSPFDIKNGVKQGAVLSAPLFALYIDELLQKLNSSRQGCHIGDLCANAFGYADDVIILSPTCKALRYLINICEEYAADHHIKFNPDKCTLLIFSDPDFCREDVHISIAGTVIKHVDKETHLGHLFQNTGNIIDFDNIIKDIRIRSNVIANKFKPVSWQGKATLFMSHCSSLYGCHLWNIDDVKLKELYTAWHVGSRRVLGLDGRTRTYLLRHLMKSMSIENIVMHRVASFFLNGLKHTNDTIKSFFENALTSNYSCMLKNINIIVHKLNMKYTDFLVSNKNEVKIHLKNTENNADWRVESVKELLNIKDRQLDCILDNNEVTMMLKYICTFR